MSPVLLGVMAFCALVGYWIMSALLERGQGKRMRDTRAQPEASAHHAEPHGATDSGAEAAAPPPSSARDAAPLHWSDVLQVSRHASDDEVRRAYKTLISQYHPDKVANLGPELRALAEAKSKSINVAYDQMRRERGTT